MHLKRVWYSNQRDVKSPDTIHQILMFGKLDEIRSLKAKLGLQTIKELFLRYPKKIYTNTAFNFVKNFILGIDDPIDEKKYLKYTPRHIR